MSVTAQTPYNGYTANGATTVFPYGFLLLDTDDLTVTVDGVEKALTTDYTVSGLNNPSGGNVTFLVAPANGAKVLLSRLLTIQRLTDYQDNGDLFAATINQDLDRLWLALQQLQQNDIRALKLPYDTATDQVISETAADRIGKLITFDASGNMILVMPADLSLQTVSSFIATLLDDVDAATARATLGLIIGTNVQAFDAAIAKLNIAQSFTKGQAGAINPLTDAATIALDLSLGNNHLVQLGGNRTLGMPTNVVVGQSGSITVLQDKTGSRTLAYAWPYVWAAGSAGILSTPGGSEDQLIYEVRSYNSAAATITIATPGVVTMNGHGFYHGQRVQLTTTGALPTGLTASTTYFVEVIDADTFYLCTSLANVAAGTRIATSGSQSGVHTLTGCTIRLALNKGWA
jgi:hypothetical protein